MKNFLTFALSGIFGLAFGLFLNDRAPHYDEVTRFFAGPIYGAMGFFGALYARWQAHDSLRRFSLFFLVYLSAAIIGFGVSLAVPPFFHRSTINASIGLDVFVCPLLTFGFAIFAVRAIRGYVNPST